MCLCILNSVYDTKNMIEILQNFSLMVVPRKNVVWKACEGPWCLSAQGHVDWESGGI